MKLIDILKEAETKNKKAQPQTNPAKDTTKDTAKVNPTANPTSKEDPEFLKQVQKGLSNTNSPAAQSADRIANRFQQKSPPPTPQPTNVDFQTNKSIPSLSQLAQDTDEKPDPFFKDFPKFDKEPDDDPFDVKKQNEKDWPEDDTIHGIGKSADRIANRFAKNAEKPTPEEPKSDPSVPSLSQLAQDLDNPESEDDMFKDFPKFSAADMADSEEWSQNPFGKPTTKEPKGSTKTPIQKGLDAFKKGAKKVLDKGADAAFGNSQEPPKSWKAGKSSSQEDEPMPSLKQTAQSSSKPQGLTAKHWNWKPGQKVDIGFIKDLTVQKVDQYGAVLQGKNGGTYRFIPHRGLRKISN